MQKFFDYIDYTKFEYKYPIARKIDHVKLVVDNTRKVNPTGVGTGLLNQVLPSGE